MTKFNILSIISGRVHSSINAIVIERTVHAHNEHEDTSLTTEQNGEHGGVIYRLPPTRGADLAVGLAALVCCCLGLAGADFFSVAFFVAVCRCFSFAALHNVNSRNV